MTEKRERDAERGLEGDLRAYRTVTDRDLPSLQDTARMLRPSSAGPSPRHIEEGFWMKSRRFLSVRPALTAVGALLVVAAILGIVPISYERTTGHQVTLALTGPALDATSLEKVARELKSSLGAQQVHVSTAGGPAEIVAQVASRRGQEVARTAQAFAAALGAKGMNFNVEVTPQKERVSSNMYALAMDRAIELNIDRTGKTPAQIEADIRAQLEAAGIQNPQVQVTQEGNQTQVQIHANSSDPQAGERQFNVNLKGDGTDPMHAQLHRFEVKRTPGMTDADVRADIERQMREAGVQGTVTVENGKVQIKVDKHQ
jgi:preprotein translocase subunit SecF